MKENIHPKYYPRAEVRCSCGAKFYIGSTVPKMEVEICSHCHPFYTGQKKIIDTTGRVQRFQQRLQKTAQIKSTKITQKKKIKKIKAHKTQAK